MRHPAVRLAWLALLAGALAGCVTAASSAYKAVTDERSASQLWDDNAITTKIRKGFLDTVPKAATALDIFCHQGNVVLAGVVEEAQLGQQALAVARGVEGVKRVDTYYLPSRPSRLKDIEVRTKLRARLIGDGDLKAYQVDMTVVAGHVVLTGIVDRQEKVDAILRHARAVEGVVAVKSFLQVKTP